MEKEAIAVKHNGVDASLEGFLGNGLAHLSGDFALVVDEAEQRVVPAMSSITWA